MKTIINVMLFVVYIFFNLALHADDKLSINMSLGNMFINNNNKNINSYNKVSNDFVVGLSFNPFYENKYIKQLFVNLNYSSFNSNYNNNNHKSYDIGLYYDIVDLKFLTFYIGYDMLGSHSVAVFEPSTEGHVGYMYNKNFYRTRGFRIGGDVKIYNSFFGYFAYKKVIMIFDRLDNFNYYVLGIKYKVALENIKKLKTFGD